jgi:hypothetical protein
MGKKSYHKITEMVHYGLRFISRANLAGGTFNKGQPH